MSLLGHRAPTTVREHLDTRPTALYAAYNHDGWQRYQHGETDQPIYVGIGCDPRRRWTRHEADKPWACEVYQWRIVAWYPNRPTAKTAETWWITTRPTRWNVDESPLANEVCQRYRDIYGCEVGDTPGNTRPPLPHRWPWPLRLLAWTLRAVLWLTWTILTGILELAYLILIRPIAGRVGIRLPRPKRHRRRFL